MKTTLTSTKETIFVETDSEIDPDKVFDELFEAMLTNMGLTFITPKDPNWDWESYHRNMASYYNEDDTPYEFVSRPPKTAP